MTSTTSPPSSLAAWQNRAVHRVWLPSTMRVKMRIPGIPTLIEHGRLPDDLVELALTGVTNEYGAAGALKDELAGATDDQRPHVLARVKDLARYQRTLALVAIVAIEREPGSEQWDDVTLTEADAALLPEDDLSFVAEIVERLRHQDAKGVTLGVEPLDRWAEFHETHQLAAEDCPHCKQLQQRLSSLDLGGL